MGSEVGWKDWWAGGEDILLHRPNLGRSRGGGGRGLLGGGLGGRASGGRSVFVGTASGSQGGEPGHWVFFAWEYYFYLMVKGEGGKKRKWGENGG